MRPAVLIAFAIAALVSCHADSRPHHTDDIVLELHGPNPDATYAIEPGLTINGQPTDVTSSISVQGRTRVRLHLEGGVWHVVQEPNAPSAP